MRVSVIGTGYLGATHATAMAVFGHDVIGVDVDELRVKQLSDGKLPFYEPGLDAALAEQVAGGRLRFTTDPDDVRGCSVHFVCVGTPQREGGTEADLSYLDDAVATLLPRLQSGDVVVGRSTVPVGTAQRLSRDLSAVGARLVWNPEFLREGHALADCLRPDRVVLGSADPEAARTVALVYEPVIGAGTPLVHTGFATAELVKVAANAFLATKISFVNAISELCDAADADVRQLAHALGLDARVGSAFLGPGIGFGGSCLPKDLRALAARSDELGVPEVSRLLHEVDAINDGRRERVVELVRAACGGSLDGRRVAVLGLAFKPDSDDVRDSPALAVANLLAAEGATVQAFDPRAMDRCVAPDLKLCATPLDACTDADAVTVLTEWDEFCRLDAETVGAVAAQRHVVDGRHCLDPEHWRSAGWDYRAVGVPA